MSMDALFSQVKTHWIAALYVVVGCYLLFAQGIPFAIRTYRGEGKIDLPGPKGWPLIGIGIDLPARPRKLLTDLADKYGDICKVQVGWYDWVILSSREAVKDVFDKQVSEYHGRTMQTLCNRTDRSPLDSPQLRLQSLHFPSLRITSSETTEYWA